MSKIELLDQLEEDKGPRKNTFSRIIIDYLGMHLLMFVIAFIVSTVLYINQFGITDAMPKLLINDASWNYKIWMLLNLYVVYPVIWLSIYSALKQNVLTFTFFHIGIGAIIVWFLTDFKHLLSYRFGCLDLLLAYCFVPVIYWWGKRKFFLSP